MITINKKTTTTTISCNAEKCKATLSVAGVRSRRAGYTLAINSDWRWKNANTHFCPIHKPANIRSAKAEKKVVAKKVTKAATTLTKPVTKTVVKATAKTVKPANKKAVKPVVSTGMGQPVAGMVAKSAKRGSVK